MNTATPKLVYASFNDAITEAWAGGAAGVTIVFGQQPANTPLPAECLWVYWLEHPSPGGQANGPAGLIQLAVRVPAEKLALALDRTNGLDSAMGLTAGAGCGQLEIHDHTAAGSPLVGHADVNSLEAAWVTTPEPRDPAIVQLVRTIELTWSP